VEAKRQLLIEEDCEARDALQRIFISRNWEVVMATTLPEAMRLLCDYVPDWVIVSWEQMEGEGERFLLAVRARSREVRVALLTGSMDTAGHRMVSRLKPDLRFRKPFLPEDVFRACEPCRASKSVLG
jgi:ActR/RegA family two-component response regulator